VEKAPRDRAWMLISKLVCDVFHTTAYTSPRVG
jgi:hypothetical protein